jgi:hypothetical protein
MSGMEFFVEISPVFYPYYIADEPEECDKTFSTPHPAAA